MFLSRGTWVHRVVLPPVDGIYTGCAAGAAAMPDVAPAGVVCLLLAAFFLRFRCFLRRCRFSALLYCLLILLYFLHAISFLGTMKIRRLGFNFYLAAALALLALCGCQSEQRERKKVLSTLRLHQETPNDPTGNSEVVVVHHDPEIKFTIAKEAFLTGNSIQDAKVIDVIGGFALKLQFDRQGTWLLEQYSAASRGRHFAIFSQFVNPGEKKLNKGSWLAAPQISNIITNGSLTFTPEVTRPEAEQIALGLNNVARKLETGKQPDF